MKRHLKFTAVILLITLLFIQPAWCSETGKTAGDKAFKKGVSLENKKSYHKAIKTYDKALKFYKKEDNAEKIDKTRQKIWKIQKIVFSYPYTREEVRKKMKKMFEKIPRADFNKWFNDEYLDHIVIDGKNYYFYECLQNVLYRHPDLLIMHPKSRKSIRDFASKYTDIIFADKKAGYEEKMWKPYTNPIKYLGRISFKIAREDLPEKGVLKVWIPHPIQTASQRDVEIISISPQKYVRAVPRVDADLGNIYMEVPLKELKDDLDVVVEFTFSHYTQKFKIDPDKVGEYDRESDLYKKYTRSAGNIAITPEIKKKAHQIVGDEKNPYLAARKIYYHVIDNVKYSLTPHLKLDATGEPESVFVLENKFGDCGAQMMYFAALCRAVGIPARSLGGMQLCPGKHSSHFWGEFYLPNYGWIPADTSIAMMLSYSDQLSESERKKLIDFFFGNLDPYRFIIQKDVDLPLSPHPKLPRFIRVCFQMPEAECEEMDQNPAYLIRPGYKVDIKPFSR